MNRAPAGRTLCCLALLFLGAPAPPLGAQEPEPEASAPAGAADAQQEAPQEPAADDRITFEIQLSPEQGGGTVTGSTGSMGSGERENLVVLDGGVELLYQDVKLKAQRLELDVETQDMLALGEVVFDEGPRRIAASRVTYNFDTELGRFEKVVGYVSQEYFFTGESVEKVAEDVYVVERGVFTSCETVPPPWSFRASRIRVRVDHFARARNATFRAKQVPMIYLPYLLWPVKEERTSGLLIPKPGYSNRRGASLGLAYYQTLGRSWDTTLEVDLFAGGAPQGSAGSGSYLGLGNELRWRPSEGSRGNFEGYGIRDPERDEWRWRIELDHESADLPGGFRGVLRLEDVSDFDFFQDFERQADINAQRQLYSNGFLTRNRGPHSLNILFDNRETFVSEDRVVTLRQLPEVEYKLRSTRLGGLPLYLQMRGSVNYLDVDRSERLQNDYGRADLFPELTLPIRSAPWWSLSVTTGARYTWYEDSLYTRQEANELATDTDFRGESLSRFVPTASAEFVGPSFSRIFEGGGKRYSRLKHVFEPRVTYAFFDEYDEDDRVPLFDEVDRVAGRNVGRFSLVNRLLAKPADEKSGGAREILSFELFQDYSFDDQRPLQSSRDRTLTRAEGPLTGLLRFSPGRRTSLRTEVEYNTLFGEVESTSVSGSFGIGKASNVGLRWTTRTDAETAETRTHQVRLSTRMSLVPDRLTLDAMVNYDIERSTLQLQRYVLGYRGSCFQVSLEASDYRTGTRRDTEYRFLLTLKNVGTFLDITGGQTATL
ncbi:MAG TPA: LPS assembly protein LptD [Thermoanaerobaculia bacterium]|nr:LPS assembly protein LptD [Thermoanaerobaculia bacterium]